VALITGGTGAIGVGVASVLKAAGAEVVITDVRNIEQVAADIGVTGMEMDVTSATSVKNAMMRICEQSGGIDILVPNAGIAVAGAIDSLSAEMAHAVMDVNFHGTFLVIREAAKILKRQGTGGHVVLISSKNVLSPGAGFGLYSASKAASHQLAKVAALELAEHGIRVNMVTPDAVFGTEAVPSGLWQAVGPERAMARNLELDQLQDYYRQRSLLKLPVTAEHVGQAVLFFVTEQTPTTGATLPVDAGVASAFPR
jgi:NAD(P)-dependent dehydrogenase (short-subunit alcohol dehydrogenase family)